MCVCFIFIYLLRHSGWPRLDLGLSVAEAGTGLLLLPPLTCNGWDYRRVHCACWVLFFMFSLNKLGRRTHATVCVCVGQKTTQES